MVEYNSGTTKVNGLLDAIPITTQPYNSANSLANSVGIAIWNGTLFYKSGTLWKYSSNGTNYNPCSVDTSYDVTDYTNLRCVDNYTYDSGWKSTSGNFTYGGTQIIFYPTVTENDKIIDQNIYYWFWEGQEIATTYNTLSVTNGGYT
ncbi:hypothetical protein, partial [Aliarcobacter butzleri]|uniref:hypothetical protein n=1 Tax=Aliarcobacter butzleri TaxID=28197 RepID=UPI002B251430